MDFLVWIIILLVINGVAGGKKKKSAQRRQSPAAPPTVTAERRPSNGQSVPAGLGTMIRDLVRDVQVVMGDGQDSRRSDHNQRRSPQADQAGQVRRSRSARQPQRELTPIEQECDYCTGRNSLGEPLGSSHASDALIIQPIVPIVYNKISDADCVDIGAIQRDMKLSDAQNVLLWQEILDKPLALRRK